MPSHSLLERILIKLLTLKDFGMVGLEYNKLELSSAKLSSLSWGWVELRLSWVEAELDLKLSWNWA